ncbi:Bug family tripartite tricarboxylate transporter substrate binding protein [Hydrogenophaga sp. BPS33]|uniref:Bug family tripartite tricarboxylate transporter substrate binding protein n=1 Tax=Hydrogenophaga sp. BPS33 TaxID=2651974 RepID=UPI001320216E|nr:tripartite tricarboxylate transporter substrate binding protein [Hydrogenophaga sp. BPS33]QHE87807.1 tripartite tricarboxylate transporter substrate binding protein [Hydrogenophaga sp. BPS33]
MTTRRTVWAFVCMAPWMAFAQTAPWPSAPITVISPVQAGSAGDTTLRVVTQKMSENMRQSFAVENVVGAAGMIGLDRLSRSRPDGYTIGGISDSTLTYVPIIQKRANFDPLDTLDPVGVIAPSTWVLVAHPSVGVKTVGELVAKAKAQPGQLNYASSGLGSSHQVVMEMFKSATGTRLLHIPYRGAAAALADVQGGQVQVMFSALSVALGAIETGKLVPLAVASTTRTPLLPQLPTVAEAVPGFSFATWSGMLVPKGTPPAIVERLNQELNKAIQDPQVAATLAKLGVTPKAGTPKDLADLIQSTRAKMENVIRTANIQAE